MASRHLVILVMWSFRALVATGLVFTQAEAVSQINVAGAKSEVVLDDGETSQLTITAELFRKHVAKTHMNDLFGSGRTCHEIWAKGENHAIQTDGAMPNEYFVNPTGTDMFFATCAANGR